MALFGLAHAALETECAVVTVDHGLRAEAARECAMVAEACAARGVDCTVLTVTPGQGNRQAAARGARYAAIAEWAGPRSIKRVATAHHADDQAETLLMRLNRGSGVAGLAGIRPATMLQGLRIVRPLLDWRRAELLSVVREAGLPFIADPSNCDPTYDRTRMRAALADADWRDAAALARSAAHLAEADALLQSLADARWAEVRDGGTGLIVPATGWLDTDARLLARTIARHGGDIGAGKLVGFLKRLEKRGTIAGCLIERTRTGYRCTPEPPRR